MAWFYADGGRQVGPLEDAALDELVRTGVVRDDTLVWREGMPNWQPLSVARPRVTPPVAVSMPPAAQSVPPAATPMEATGFCSNCGRPLQPGQTVRVGNTVMCSNCGPSFGQPTSAYAQPAPTGFPGQPAVWANRAIGYIIDSLFVVVAMAAIYAVGIPVFSSIAGLGGLAGSQGLNGLGAVGSSIGVFGCCCMLALGPVATILVGLYNKVHLVSQRGYSVGQGVMKIKIVDGNGNLLTFQTALIRLLAQAGLSFIPFLGAVDLLWPLWDAQRQTLHDKAVGSFAINDPARQ
jgi:uncharacterized RDD family membrane protein YckC